MNVRRVSLLPLLVVLIAACSSPLASATPASQAPASAGAGANLTILGASSLKGVLDKVKTAYEAANPGTTLTISSGSSSALETQIEQGAPADVFLSADSTNPTKLVDKGLNGGDPTTFAGNKLTVIVPTDNKAGIQTPADLARPGIKVIAAGEDVPITKYATMLVANLAMQAGYPAGFVDSYTANIASREEDVTSVVGKIELGEGDGAIVYVTDAKASDKVTPIAVPDDANVPATYQGVVVNASQQSDAAKAFLAWFAGPEGQAILQPFGFLPPAS